MTAAAEKDGEELIAVIFKSEDPNRWLDAKNLFEYGYNQYEKITVAKAEEAIADAPLTKHKKIRREYGSCCIPEGGYGNSSEGYRKGYEADRFL